MKQTSETLTPMVDGFKMPDSTDFEIQVLADLITEPQFIPLANGTINSEMFSDNENRTIWNRLNEMLSKGETIDLTTLMAKVGKKSIIKVLDSRFFGYVADYKVMNHCNALYQVFIKRMIFARSLELLRMSATNEADFEELISFPGKITETINNNSLVGVSTEPISKVLNDLANEIESAQSKAEKGIKTKITTGFTALDEITNKGFENDELVILSARPSVGKTSVMLQMAVSASKSGIPTTVYSLEMKNTKLARKLLFSTDLVTPGQLARNEIEWQNIEKANKQFDNLPIWFNCKSRRMETISNDIRVRHQQGKCGIAFIDYLGLIESNNPKVSTYEKVSAFTRQLKNLAMECNIPIVVLCQLNRISESENKAPELYHLRDSGSIEQDSDIVLMLERVSGSKDDPNINMWVRKNRNGIADKAIRLVANNTFTWFNCQGFVNYD